MKTWLLVPFLAASVTAHAGKEGAWTSTLQKPGEVQRFMRQISRPMRVVGGPYRAWREKRDGVAPDVARMRGQVAEIAREVKNIKKYRPTFLGRYGAKTKIVMGWEERRIIGVVVARTPNGKPIVVDASGRLAVATHGDGMPVVLRGLLSAEAAGFDPRQLEPKLLRMIEILKDPSKAKDGEIELVHQQGFSGA